jgi:hypothetical protein
MSLFKNLSILISLLIISFNSIGQIEVDTTISNSIINQLPPYLTTQTEKANIRESPNSNGKLAVQVKIFERLIILQKNQKDIVNGVEDYWYKVKTETEKEGYIFGDLTSLRLVGKKTEFLAFEDQLGGDCISFTFSGIKLFFSGTNGYEFPTIYTESKTNELIDSIRNGGDFEKKKFKITYNNLILPTGDYCSTDLMSTNKRVNVIMNIELID